MKKINIKINGLPFKVEEGLTVLEAAKKCGFAIPSLCHFYNNDCSLASCRVCLVEVKGQRNLIASCVFPVSEGMEINISSEKATSARRASVELLLSNHSQNCQQCEKNGKCELLEVAKQVGARDGKYAGSKSNNIYDNLSPSLIRDTSKCILCGRCVERCKNVQGIGVLSFQKRGFNTVIGPAENRSFKDSPCIMCGQCVLVCPTGALMEKSDIPLIDQAKKDGKYIVVQTAPAVRASLGEEFDLKVGTRVTGKMIAALKRLGFYRVYDVNFGADLTIMEEANELLYRIKHKGILPMITSCSPGWVNYAETTYPELLPHLSSCKSPHEMQGAIIKSYFAKVHKINPKDIFVVSVMPCTAKKFEKERPQLITDGLKDVDAVITTRELGRLIKRAGIDFVNLKDEDFDQDIMGEYSGAGAIFGVTGGVMEAALRTAYHEITGKEYSKIVFQQVRGLDGIKDATITIGSVNLRVAVASSMKNAKILLDELKEGKSPYHFIEIMGCPGGCINGGGQSYVKPMFLKNESPDIWKTYISKRMKALYTEDEKQKIRQSHNNKQIQELYKKFLGKPNGELTHHLLHTSYKARQKFPKI